MGYWRHKHLLAQALDAISAHGLPVDRKRQDELREYLVAEEERLTSKIQQLVPDAVRPSNRKVGYKSLPKDLRALLKERGLLQKGLTLDYYITQHYDLCNSLDYYVRAFDNAECDGLVKVLPFNPNSSDQLLAYIRWQMDHGDRSKRWYIPVHIDTGNPTVGQAEIDKLIEETDDEVLKLTRQVKKAVTFKSRYAANDWIPRADGRVHGTFRFGTATQQTSCTTPNVQQMAEHYDPKDLWMADVTKRLKSCIKAEPGHTLIKVDARSAHARMQGFLAEDRDYYRLASLDVHSYVTAYYVNHPLKDRLLAYDDIELSKQLKLIKKAHEYDRNFKVKRTIYLMQFQGQAEKAYKILSAFNSIAEVEDLMNMIRNDIFPKSFNEYPKKVAKQLSKSPRLITPHGCCRWIWDNDIQQAVAFSVANPFHCHIQDAMIRLYERGAYEKYGACNFCHDSIWYHCINELVDECIEVTTSEMERPSDVLINSLGRFWCAADSQTGPSLSEVKDYAKTASG